MTHDPQKRKSPEELPSELKKKEDLQNDILDSNGQGVTAETLRRRLDDLCHEFNADHLDPVARLLHSAEIKRVREAIATIERVSS